MTTPRQLVAAVRLRKVVPEKMQARIQNLIKTAIKWKYASQRALN
jgi:hypothetical protein